MDRLKYAKIVKKLEKLTNAFYELGEAFEDVDEGELNDFICDNFPFDNDYMSIMMNVSTWASDSIYKINQAIIEDTRKDI